MEKTKEKTPNSVRVLKYSLLTLSLGLYFGAECYEAASFCFLGYMFFTEWAWTKIFDYSSSKKSSFLD